MKKRRKWKKRTEKEDNKISMRGRSSKTQKASDCKRKPQWRENQAITCKHGNCQKVE